MAGLSSLKAKIKVDLKNMQNVLKQEGKHIHIQLVVAVPFEGTSCANSELRGVVEHGWWVLQANISSAARESWMGNGCTPSSVPCMETRH